MTDRQVGMTPRGEAMPQTIEEWRHLVDLDEVAMRRMVKEIGELKSKVAHLTQKRDSLLVRLKDYT
jgi:hypothetical protein|tara:strand:- start:145 stop:342 length:198 start_codon:yes stop_codon:yes gene_type:complete